MASIWTILGVSAGCLPALPLPRLRGREGWGRQRPEKIKLGWKARRHRQIEMPECDPGQHAATRRALHKALLEQVRLDDFLDDVALVPERCRNRLDPNRTARIILGNTAQITPVHAVEAAR